MCTRLNPCFCCPGPPEVGVFIMSLLHSLYLTALFLVGLAIGYDTMLIVFYGEELSPHMSIHVRIFHAVIFVWYVVTFIAEVVLREYLFKTIEMSTETKIRRCHFWIRARLLQISVTILFGLLHLFLRTTKFKLTLYCVFILYHLYYTWIIYDYVKLLEKPQTIQPVIQSGQFTIAVDPGVPLSTLKSKQSK